MPRERRFSEQSLPTLVGHEDDLIIDSERLGHASADATKKLYRDNITKVTPLSFLMKLGMPHYYWCITPLNLHFNRKEDS